ncbi:MAG: undecaprenyl-phosphate glucose phosphotransferase [Fimbriiglobus sp.]|nr:undecaprenyl-phosphate glucose phosphotransferase [Fimbriiglobus sp.]
MVNRTSHPLRLWFLVLDVAALVVAWFAAYWVRFESGWVPLLHDHQPDFALCIRGLPLVVILGMVCCRHARLYEVHRLTRFREEAVAVAKGVILTTLLTALVAFALRYEYESRIAFALFAVLAALGVLAARRLSWFTLGRLRARGINQSHALIVGTGRLARRTARTLRASSWTGIQTVAYVEDDPDTHQTHCDIPVIGPIADLPALVQKHHIEHVFIALPMNRYADARRVFDQLSQTIVDVRLVADVPALSALSFTTTRVHGMTFIGLRESTYHGVNVWVKRSMDVFLSAVAIILLSPLLLLIALLVKLTSRGPVFYRQERCSLNGEPFQMLKFRTMRADAEKHGPQMTSANDPRRTRFGTFLRVTNLDELPQLFNVLRGDMSLVGPRPERPVFVRKFQKSIPNYMARHAVKCGMTGWAQVNGWRGNSSLRKRVQYDLYYITHWNPLFDLRIMLLTVWHMLTHRSKHAY